MNYSAKIFLAALVLLAVAGGALAWQKGSPARQWTRLRPALPAPMGDTAPGLDARLAACGTKFDQWPAARDALMEFTLVCHANGLIPEAIHGYQALNALDPGEARWPHLLAGILSGFGRIEEALPLLERAAALAPAQPIVWQRLGEARLKDNRMSEAATAFEQVLRLRPADIHALFGLARCDLQAGRLTAARSRLQEAVAANPDFPGAQTLLATVYERLGNPDAAQIARARVSGDGHYTEAPDLWEVDLTSYCHIPYTLLVAASALSSDGKLREALPLLDRALALAPQDARLHRQLGNTLVRLGELPAARPRLERALALDPTDEKIRTDLIKLLKELPDHPAADQAVLQGLVTNPESTAFRFEAGLIAVRQGRHNEAIGYFQEVWVRQPDQTAAPRELATAYFASDRAEAGQAVLEKTLARHPADPVILTMLVRRGIETGDPRTGEWMRRTQATGKATPSFTALQQAYLARFGTMP